MRKPANELRARYEATRRKHSFLVFLLENALFPSFMHAQRHEFTLRVGLFLELKTNFVTKVIVAAMEYL